MSQDYVVDVYLSVRLEAGSLHFVNYLICATFYYLDQKVTLFLHLQNAVVPQTEKPPASRCHSSSSSNGFRLCKNGLQGSGIHFLSSQIFPRSSRKRFDKMSFGATGDGLETVHLHFIYGGSLPRHPLRRTKSSELLSIYAPRGIRRIRAPHSFTPAATRLPQGRPEEDPRTPSRRLRLRRYVPQPCTSLMSSD